MYKETYVDMWNGLEYNIQGVHPTYTISRGNLEQHKLNELRHCDNESGFDEEENNGTVCRLQRAGHAA